MVPCSGISVQQVDRLGVVVCDHQGLVLASLAEKVRLPLSSNDVEAMAAVKSITFAYEFRLSSIITDGDFVVIKALRSEDQSLASFGNLLSAAKPTIYRCL